MEYRVETKIFKPNIPTFHLPSISICLLCGLCELCGSFFP
jgi:hypothetical protein